MPQPAEVMIEEELVVEEPVDEAAERAYADAKTKVVALPLPVDEGDDLLGDVPASLQIRSPLPRLHIPTAS